MEYDDARMADELIQEAKTFQKQGKNVSFLSVDGILAGFRVIGDKIKPTSAKAIKMLQDKGIGIIMLTSDNHQTGEA